jgi:hypothetical protein
MTIEVYDSPCLAAIGAGIEEFDVTDLDGDCITGIGDFAKLAKTYLVDYEIPDPVVKVIAISTDKSSYAVGETILYSYRFAAGNDLDYVAVYQAGSGETSNYEIYYYLRGKISGSIEEEDPQLEAGDYEARLIFNDTYKTEATAYFTVVE